MNLLLARYGFTFLSRLSLIFLPPVIFLLGPTLIGYVEEESYTYYPYLVITMSILPQLLFNPREEKFLYWSSLTFYFLLTIFIDPVMVRFSDIHFPIVERIKTFYPFYKIAHIGIFLFINTAIYYLKTINFRFEDELARKNKELNEQNITLLEQKKEIEQHQGELLNKEISTWKKLINIISHEIVNSAIPITNLAGMSSQMMEDENGSLLKPEAIGEEVAGDIHQSLKIIETRTQALVKLVKATKDLSLIPQPVIRKFNIQELFDRIAKLYQAKFSEKRISVETRVDPPGLVADADMELIEQVIINLIQNSLEAMEDVKDPKLILEASTNVKNRICISVTDNGKGISNEVIDQIFLPYFSTKHNNSGIGLSISQQILMMHSGKLEVTSEVNKGTTLRMIF
jgi:signal transduction histidine kinase